MTTSERHRLTASALDPAHSVVVEACAGSGKTWLLVSRIVRLLLAGVPPGEILAITFTRQAAQEMQDRLHQWLRALAVESDERSRQFLSSRALPPDAIESALAQGRALYQQVLNAQPALTITTFHSWFLQVLRKAPMEAGAMGNLALVERTSALVEESWSLFMEDCRRDPGSRAAQAVDFLFTRYGLYGTRPLLASFLEHRGDWWAYAGNAPDAVERALAQQASLLAPAGAGAAERLFGDERFLADVRELMDCFARNIAVEMAAAGELASALDEHRFEDALSALAQGLLTEKLQPRSKRPSNAQAQRLGAAGEARYLQLCAALGARVLAAMQDRADEASYRANEAGLAAGAALLARYQQLKQDRQVLDFTDVEWLAYELLVRRQHAVTMHFKLDSRYRHILLDEFQDTNPLQWLAFEAWFAAALQADRAPGIFMVGDPKQAIFRFRRADARLFEAARDWLRSTQEAAVHTLDESRRCAQPVLDVVNRAFGAELSYRPFADHHAHDSGRPGRVEVLPLARSEESIDAAASASLRDPLQGPRVVEEDTRREREAELLVSRLAEILGRWWIVDEGLGVRTRPVRYGDIMMLVRRRTHLQIYERALRHAGMPFVTSRQGGLLDTLEAEDLMALLEFLVSPFDDLKLAHALRTPLFDLSDEDLLRVAEAAGASWWQRLDPLATAAASPAIVRARALLERWLDFADRLPVHDVLDRIYFEGDVLRRYQAAVPAAMRPAVRANLDAFIQRALEVDSGRYPSLPRFLAELRDMRRAPAEEAPDEGEVATHGDAIRIMTIHGAKGLEAPIVWLLDATASAPTERGFDALVQWEPGEPAPASFSLRTRARELSRAQRALLESEARHDQREELNLLYVAMTRARQALFVSGCDSRSWAASWYGRVRSAVVAASGCDAPPARPVHHGQDLDRPDLEEGPAVAAAVAKRLEGGAEDQGQASAARPKGALQLALDFSSPAAKPVAALAGIGRRSERLGSAAMRYGTAFHMLMQHARAGARFEPGEWASRLGLPLGEVTPLCRQASALLADPSLARFFEPDRYQRALNEWPLVTAAGVLRVDRLVEFAAQVWVLDYKAGGWSAVAGTALEQDYREQVAGYCNAVQCVFPSKEVRGLLLFADGSRLEIGDAQP